jgi:hypothetical protein
VVLKPGVGVEGYSKPLSQSRTKNSKKYLLSVLSSGIAKRAKHDKQ